MPLFTLPFSTRIRPPTPRRPARLALAAAAVAASVTLAGFAPAALAGASVPSGGSALAAATVAGREHPRPATRGVSARGADAFAEEAADAVRSARKPMSPVTSSGGASVFGAAAPDVVSAGHHFYIGSISLNDGVVLRQLAAGVAPGRLGLKQASRATITAPAPTATRPGTTVQTEPTVQTGTTVHTDAVVHPDAAGPTTMYPPTYVDPSSPRYTVSSDAFPNNGEWTAIPAPMTKADCLRNIGGPTGTWVEDRFRSCAAYTGYSWVDPDPYDPAAIAGFSFDMVVTAYGSSTARNMQFSYYASNFQFENTGYLNDLSISMSCTPGNTVGDCHFDRGTFNETAGDWAAAPAGTAQVTFNASSDDDPAHVYASDPDKLTPAQASTTYGFEAGDPIVEQYPQPFRFDSTSSISGRPQGAVFSNVVPTLAFDQGDARIAQAAMHIYDALNHPEYTTPTWPAGVKTIPGAGSDPTDFLTRLLGGTGNTQNRNASCSDAATRAFSPPDYTALNLTGTSNPQCDEFPPASTWEGGYDTSYTTTPAFSARWIDATQNGTAGKVLNAFYATQRLLNGDSFAVAATGMPPNTAPFPVPNIPEGGQFLTAWDNSGGFTGSLGAASYYPAYLPSGQFQTYATGVITWSPATGTHTVSGAIATEYFSDGGPSGALGYPTGEQYTIGDGTGQDFQNGTIYSSPTGTYRVYHDLLTTYLSAGGPTSAIGFPVAEQASNGGGVLQMFQSGQIADLDGTVTLSRWAAGHAVNAGNDYPYETLGQFNNTQDGTDAWNEFYGQCDSFAAWKVYENLAGAAAQHPGSVPAPGWTPSNASVSPVNQFTWGPNGGKYGNADVWATKFAALGYTVDTVPTPGAIAYWPNAVTDPQDGNPPDAARGMGEFGHVAFVSDVYPDGSITVQGYNMRENGEYSAAHMPFGQGYTDTGFNQGSFSVPWPKYFIHVADGPSGAASPSEPANGMVQAGNPSQVLVIGPGSPSSQFTTGNVWYNDPGHGEIGKEEYTHTNGPTAVSTATWTAPVTASACYRVDALVPDQYSDNPTAIYTVTDEVGTHTAAVNENDYTSDWAELGVYQASTAGQITVRLDDRGNTGLYVAADAMRFWPQSCSAYGDAAPVTMATSANGTWSVLSGHGFFGTEQYATTSGSVTTENKWADYSVGVLPNTCYEISAYVPDNYSDTPAARYQVQDAHYGNFYPQVDENGFTSQFASLGIFRSTGSGTLWVELGNEAPAGLYVAADALAFVVDPGCAGLPSRATPAGATLVGLNDNSAWFSTTGNWNSGIGHGFFNHDLWIPTTTSGTPSSTATWNAFLKANACYNVSAWIPNNYYANNTQASYQVMTWNGANGAGGPFGTVNQNSYGDAWAPIGRVTTQTGEVSVTLGNTGNSSSYTAADELAFFPC